MRLNILAFAAGIIALQMQPELPAAWPWALAGSGVGRAGDTLAHVPPVRVLGVLACLALGFAWAAWRADIRLADALPAAWEGRDIEVVGVVAALPQDFSQGSRFEFAVEKVSTVAAVVPQRIMLSWYQGQRDGEEFIRQPLKPGERWQLTVRLKRPHGNANPNGFDYEAWLLERNIRATGYVRQNPPQRLVEMVWRPDYVVERLRLGVRDSFAALLPAENYPWAGILVALVVGDQRAIQGDLWTTFNRTGTTHLMSISGLHVTMVAALFGLFDRLCLAARADAGAASAGATGGPAGRVPGRVLLRPARRIRGAGTTHAVHATGRRAGDELGTGRSHRAAPCCLRCWSSC